MILSRVIYIFFGKFCMAMIDYFFIFNKKDIYVEDKEFSVETLDV